MAHPVDSDSNDEKHWKNDYPDEDLCRYLKGKQSTNIFKRKTANQLFKRKTVNQLLEKKTVNHLFKKKTVKQLFERKTVNQDVGNSDFRGDGKHKKNVI